MAIAPLRPGAFRATSAALLMTQTRQQLDLLQGQLASDRRAETFGGLGAERGTSLDMRAQLSAIGSLRSGIQGAETRLQMMDRSLERMRSIGADLRSTAVSRPFDPDASGKTSMQKLARLQFEEVVDLLNGELNGSRLFGGRRTDSHPVLDARAILEGDAAGRAGLNTLVAERKLADRGAGTGRLLLAGGGPAATIAEESAPLAYGLKLASAAGSAAITAGYAAGPPANIDFTVTGTPADGETVRVALTLPDGSTETIALTARTSVPPGGASAGEFEIGAGPAATGANLRAALGLAVDQLVNGALPIASARAAAVSFFAGTPTTPPARVPAPAATATAPIEGTAADTVIWYQGDDAATDPRLTTIVPTDDRAAVGIGARANEAGIQSLLANLAVFATETFGAQDQARYGAMTARLRDGLADENGRPSVKQIQTDLSLARVQLKAADERLGARKAIVDNTIGEVEGINREEVAAKLLSLQTRLQATYQTTAIIARLNLTDYLR
jgi:flagellin-like hook-associated protein FlgL